MTELEHAVRDVDAIWLPLKETFDGEPLRDATRQQIDEYLATIPESLPSGGSLVLYWSGHGVSAPGRGVKLMASDSHAAPHSGLLVQSVVEPCAYSGADQLLLIIDTCFSGGAIPTATEVAAAVLEARPPDSDRVWVGVLASSTASSTAVDGRLGSLLHRLLVEGPQLADLRRRWSPHNARLSGYDLADAVVKEWGVEDERQPRLRSEGNAWWMFPNPLFRPGAPRQVVEHLLRAARGSDTEESFFSGRAGEVDRVVGWVQARRPGLFVVTGSAGTGKSAILGRVVSLSDPGERSRLHVDIAELSHGDPGASSVRAARARAGSHLRSACKAARSRSVLRLGAPR